jgi:hypothetical protein
VHAIDASVSKKRKTKQHLKYDQLCHEQRYKQHATRNWSQETSEEVDEERKRKELHHDVRNEASNA